MTDLSRLATFDDVMRCAAVLSEGIAEEEFQKFCRHQDECRNHWLQAVHEAQRLQRDLESALRTITDLETKLYHARKLLETESKLRKKADLDRDNMEKKMSACSDILMKDGDIKDETRNKLTFLYQMPKKRKSLREFEKIGNDVNSTGSFLSDMSLTQSEDDFLDPHTSTNGFKKHRLSFPSNGSYLASKKNRASQDGVQNRRSNNNNFMSNKNKIIEIHDTDKIVAHTKVTVPQDNGPIYAESIIEAVPQVFEAKKKSDRYKTPTKKSPAKAQPIYTPSAPTLDEINQAYSKGATLDTRRNMLQHDFVSKTFLLNDTCMQCSKRIRFGSVSLKCKECRACVHIDCKNKFSMACVPNSNSTPVSKRTGLGVIGDHAPNVGPLIPALIVHCINEVETRGLQEIGIYRSCGSERDIKALKEIFLSGKTLPNLQKYDIHVLCGCIKDFLRSLREPLIPTSLWIAFSNAVQATTPEKSRKSLYDAITQLPRANRDTLAYLVLHLQRVAQSVVCKMPITNLSRVFGPTVVGYSCAEPDSHQLFAESVIQASVMEHILNIESEFWLQYININYKTTSESDSNSNYTNSKAYPTTPVTPFFGSARKERKFYATPPYTKKK